MIKSILTPVSIVLLLCSCRSIITVPNAYKDYQPKERHVVAIFMDGTRDRLFDAPADSLKRSHVQTTFSMVAPGVKALYIEGVGAGNRLIQATRAGTTNKRVMMAYRFLSENYKPGDSICLFGFSRGANQCRILSGILYTIGIIRLDSIKRETIKKKLLLNIYDRYTMGRQPGEKKKNLSEFIAKWNALNPGQGIVYNPNDTVKIELMGLWDTVEALEVGDRNEIPVPLSNHLNQLYNVNKLFHAVSLDDNRAFNYTPVLATHNDVLLHPWQDINSIVDEVWFSGNHKNVGGGNFKYPQLNNLSLKWMLTSVKPFAIFNETYIPTTIYGQVKDMRKGVTAITALGDSIRGIDKYWKAMNPVWNGHRIKVHRSVIDRMSKGLVPQFKNRNGKYDWYYWEPFSSCFREEQNGTITFLEDQCDCIEVVN